MPNLSSFLFSFAYFVPKILWPIRSLKTMTTPNQCQRLTDVPGFEDRRNDILYHPAVSSGSIPIEENANVGVLVYFGGDIQDYRERMEAHRDNRRYAHDRCLETTAASLSKKFPSSPILIIKPNRMYLGSFAGYSNFLQCNDIGAPAHPPTDHRAWEHLKLLLDNVGPLITTAQDFSTSKVRLVGFSKGAVVLNQLVYELRNAQPGSIADQMIDRVMAWYWLDGAHAGSKKTWITDVDVLDSLANRALKNHARINAHVTPRQVRDPGRPWIGQEEAKFSHVLARRLGNDLFTRKLHFEDEESSLENHFRVLDVFEPDRVN